MAVSSYVTIAKLDPARIDSLSYANPTLRTFFKSGTSPGRVEEDMLQPSPTQ